MTLNNHLTSLNLSFQTCETIGLDQWFSELWSLEQQHQQGSCKKCTFSGPPQTNCSRNSRVGYSNPCLRSLPGDSDTKVRASPGQRVWKAPSALPSVKCCDLVVFEWQSKRPCVASGRESSLGWAAWRVNLLSGGESPGLTNDYRSHGEKSLGRVSLATWKGSSDNMGEVSPGA